MLDPISEPAAVADAKRRVQLVADSPNDLRSEWLDNGHRIAAAEESAIHFDEEQCGRFANAFRDSGRERLIAVATEAVAPGEEVYSLAATADDLAAFDRRCAGWNFALLPAGHDDCVILCSTDDFLLIAGSEDFVVAAVGELEQARAAFNSYALNAPPQIHPALRRAAAYFDR